jgi:hypothetical protein
MKKKRPMKADADLDLGTLETDWLSQTRRMTKATELQAEAKKDLDEAEATLDVAKADAAKRIRKNPKKYGLATKTEAAVKEAVTTHPKVQEAVAAVIQAKYAVNILAGKIKGLDSRKATLENLVTLFGQGYFSKPRLKKGIDDRVREKVNDDLKYASYTRKRNH